MDLHFENLPSVQLELLTPRFDFVHSYSHVTEVNPSIDEDPFHIPMHYQRLFVAILEEYIHEPNYMGYLDKI